MSYRAERFNRSMRSLEAMISAFKDASKASVFSDRGAGVGRLVSEIDANGRDARSTTDRSRKALLRAAERRLRRAGLGHLVPTLRLIVRNGNNRQESIGEMTIGNESAKAARKRYERHRARLLAFFDVASVHMEI